MLHISTIHGHERMSTRDLLVEIASAVERGETEIQIFASGQHDIGGPLWNRNGEEITLRVRNPGQRTGSMCLPGTRVIVDGSVPADAGWLNSGGEIIVKGDAGDTAGHCAAAGIIYIGGRAGTRAGSLMKHDPRHEPPELWILKNTGSFSFEFMSGGYAIVCGHECLSIPSVLGERPGVGMVGGTVFFRGNIPELPPDVMLKDLDECDIDFLDKGLDRFLGSLGRPGLKKDLSIWKHWRKLVPCIDPQKHQNLDLHKFREENWISEGLFSDILKDDYHVASLVDTGFYRLQIPLWENLENCTDCRICLKACPKAAIRRRVSDDRFFYDANAYKCIGCGICAASCTKSVWIMQKNRAEE